MLGVPSDLFKGRFRIVFATILRADTCGHNMYPTEHRHNMFLCAISVSLVAVHPTLKARSPRPKLAKPRLQKTDSTTTGSHPNGAPEMIAHMPTAPPLACFLRSRMPRDEKPRTPPRLAAKCNDDLRGDCADAVAPLQRGNRLQAPTCGRARQSPDPPTCRCERNSAFPRSERGNLANIPRRYRHNK